MKPLRYLIALLYLLPHTKINAQQPVKIELVKLAETVVLPPFSPAEAFSKCQVEGHVDDGRMFNEFYSRINSVRSDINQLTARQTAANAKHVAAAEKALANDFGNMTTREQATYMKNNPALQQSTGVSASMVEFAAKMEDPAFKKKFDAMSDMEKVKLVQQYQKPQVQMNRKMHSQEGLKTVMQAAKIIQQFNLDYRAQSLLADREAKEKVLNKAEQEELKPVLAEKSRLVRFVGAGGTTATSAAYKKVLRQEWEIRHKTYEKKLKLYRENVLSLISSYKLAVRPFDDYLAKINYGDSLNASNEAKELGQLGGYQDGLLRHIMDIQAEAKQITLSAASFYKAMQEAQREK